MAIRNHIVTAHALQDLDPHVHIDGWGSFIITSTHCSSHCSCTDFGTMDPYLGLLLVSVSLSLGFVSSQEIAENTAQYPFGDVRNCPAISLQDSSQPLYQMEVLPGIGFDALRSIDMGQVHSFNYSLCQTSKDGKYLLPDGIFVIPIQESKVEAYAEYFDHWDNYTSMTSSSINFHAGFFSVVSGKFSDEYKSVKSHQINDQTKTTRVQIRHKLYSVKIQPDAPLHSVFKARLFDIAANLQNNNTGVAQYLAQLLVRDYGTHYLTSLDAGAILSQTDFISNSYVANLNGDSTKISASASADFFGKVSIGGGFSHSTSTQDQTDFITNRKYSEVVTIGGPPFKPNLTLTDWEQGVPDALVAIDRSGDPLHYVINPTTLAELPEPTVRQLAHLVEKIINKYYRINTRRGCTNPGAENFDFQANIDDNTCQPPLTNFTFGGVFQTCTVDSQYKTEDLCTSGPQPAQQINPSTGDLSCPQGYTPIKLHSGLVTHVTQKPVCNNVCHHCGLFGWHRCCSCQSVLAPFLSRASYEAYWCAALPGQEVPQNSGYLFGGFYTSTESNPVTGSMSCPRFFSPLHIGEDIKVCVSSDYERGYAYAVPFGGFDSCIVGNPMATQSTTAEQSSTWPHDCPHGYAQHLVTVDEGCEVDFCVIANAFKHRGLLPAKLPPFHKHPKYKANVTDALVVFGVYGTIWEKNSEGLWVITRPEGSIDSGKELLMSLSGDSSSSINGGGGGSDSGEESLSNAVVATASVMGTLLLCTLIVIVVFMGRCAFRLRRKKLSAQRQESYMQINDSADSPPEENRPSDSAENA